MRWNELLTSLEGRSKSKKEKDNAMAKKEKTKEILQAHREVT